MHLWMVIIGVIVIISIITLLVGNRGRKAIIQDYPNIAWSALASLISVFLGAYLAFQTDNIRQDNSEIAIVKHQLANLLLETSGNISSINMIRSGFDLNEVSVVKLNDRVALDILSEPLMIKHTDPSIMIAISTMVQSIDICNDILSLAVGHFASSGRNQDKMLDNIKTSLDVAEFEIRTMQRLVNKYVVDVLNISPNSEEMKRLKSWFKIRSIKEFQDKLIILRKEGNI